MHYSGVVLVRHHLETLLPAVLFHEFGHFYFRGWTEKWLVEGINSFLPVAIHEQGLLDRDTASIDNVHRCWGFGWTQRAKDIPVINDFRRDYWNFYYSKTYKVQYLISRELGENRYMQFVRKVASGMSDYSYSITTTLRLLDNLKAMNWKYFLPGWLFDGPYTVFSLDHFGDTDGNGNPDVADHYTLHPEGLPLHFKQKKLFWFWIDDNSTHSL